MAKYLDDSGLSYFKGKNDTIYAGSLTLTSNNKITLKSKSGATLSEATIASVALTGNPGLMTAADKTKLNGITAQATKTAASATNGNILIDGVETPVYTHPTPYDGANSGLYKVAVDAAGHVTATTAVVKADITALGIPGSDTKYTHPSHTSHEAGIYKITVNTLGHVTAASKPTDAEWRAALPEASTSGSGLMTTAQVIKLNGIATGAEVNTINTVKVNNAALSISNKTVNIDLSNYALKSEIAEGVNFKGTVANWAALPTTGNNTGDMYIVTAADATHSLPANGNVIWDGTSWDIMGEMFTIDAITTAEIDALFE